MASPYANQYFNLPEKPNVLSDDTRDWLAGGLGLFVAVAIILLLVIGIANSQGGPSVTDHPKSLPAGVVELSSTNYLINHDSTATAGNLCWGDNGDSNNPITVSLNRWVPQIHSWVVQCGASQSWNKHVPQSPMLIAADWRFMRQESTWILGGLWLMLFMLPGTYKALGDFYQYRRVLVRYRASLEDIRREVRLAFVNSEIDQDKMINALNRLYDAGVKPEQDAPLPREIRALDSYGKEE